MLDAKLFGVREICDVVLRAKAPQKIGSRIFYTNEPVLYFDTLKTSSFEGAATTVYAQGGRGNARLMAWDGERTVTFTMEDALISPAGLSILSGAGLISPADRDIYVHKTEQLQLKTVTTLADPGDCTIDDEPTTGIKIKLGGTPTKANDAVVYVMILDDNGVINTEPYIASVDDTNDDEIIIKSKGTEYTVNEYTKFKSGSIVLIDYYEKKTSNVLLMNITPDKFGGTFYLEASTLWRDSVTGEDLPAEFIIPKCKIQSNFTFNMASSGDPSSFTFTMDAFPDYTRFDKTEKVLASIQIIGANDADTELTRITTDSDDTVNEDDQLERTSSAVEDYSFTLSKEIITVPTGTAATNDDAPNNYRITITNTGNKTDGTYSIESTTVNGVTVSAPTGDTTGKVYEVITGSATANTYATFTVQCKVSTTVKASKTFTVLVTTATT